MVTVIIFNSTFTVYLSLRGKCFNLSFNYYFYANFHINESAMDYAWNNNFTLKMDNYYYVTHTS